MARAELMGDGYAEIDARAEALGHTLGVWRTNCGEAENRCAFGACGLEITVDPQGVARGRALRERCRFRRGDEDATPLPPSPIARPRPVAPIPAWLAAAAPVSKPPPAPAALPPPSPPSPTVPEPVPPTVGRYPHRLRADLPYPELEAALVAGRTAGDVATSSGVSLNGVQRLQRRLLAAGKIAACFCGGPAAHRGRHRGVAQRDDREEEILAALRAGERVGAIAHRLFVGEDRVRALSRPLEAAGTLTACGCGKPLRHRGRCAPPPPEPSHFVLQPGAVEQAGALLAVFDASLRDMNNDADLERPLLRCGRFLMAHACTGWPEPRTASMARVLREPVRWVEEQIGRAADRLGVEGGVLLTRWEAKYGGLAFLWDVMVLAGELQIAGGSVEQPTYQLAAARS